MWQGSNARVPWSRIVRESDRLLLCVTTLSHRRFIDDAIQMVGLPLGARLLLRYRKQYASPEVWRIAGSEIDRPVHVLLVLGADRDGVPAYEPLRVARVCTASIEGEIITLEVSMGGYASEGAYIWGDVKKHAHDLPKSLSPGGAEGGYYLQLLKGCPASLLVDGSVDAWERAASAFFRQDSAHSVPFLYSMRGVNSGFSHLRRCGSLIVESGAKLKWDVHVTCAPFAGSIVNPLGEVTFDLSCPNMRMITSRRIRADSRRDMKRMQLGCDAVFRQMSGHLSVRVTVFQASQDAPSPAGERQLITLSRCDIPVRVGWILPAAASLAAAIAAGVAMWKGRDWSSPNNLLAMCAGVLVFLSLTLGFRGKGS